MERRCENCGTVCSMYDRYCPHCGRALAQQGGPAPERDKDYIDGYTTTQWGLFIEKNASRYLELFGRNRGKTWFFHMNWAAFFFSFVWAFYRKMYRLGVLLMAAALLGNALVTGVLLAVYKPEYEQALALLERDEEQENGVLHTVITPQGVMTENAAAYSQAMDRLSRKILSRSLCILLPFSALFGLLADCLYKRHCLRRMDYCLRHMDYAAGDVSIGGAIGAVALNAIVLRQLNMWIAQLLLQWIWN